MSELRRPRPPTDRTEPRDPYANEGGELPPGSVGEALARARMHGRSAASESLAAVRALIDAAALASGGRASEASRLLGPIAKLFESLGDELGGSARDGSSQVLESIVSAIDGEISVWEERARNDTEARTVLRAFLGLREILWEFGVRHGGPDEPKRPAAAPRAAVRKRPPVPKSARPRVQRVPVQG